LPVGWLRDGAAGLYERSHIGGSDVIRLRIINEMHRFGCPLPRDAWLLENDGRYRKGGVTLPLK
jgi:hypothetical protein